VLFDNGSDDGDCFSHEGHKVLATKVTKKHKEKPLCKKTL
jgi:hypothetical protein